MKYMHKTVSLLISTFLLSNPLLLCAQQTGARPGTRAAAVSLQGNGNMAQAVLEALQQQAFMRRPEMTVNELWSQWQAQGWVDGTVLTAILCDEEYVRTLSLDEASALAYMAQFAAPSRRYPAARWEEKLLQQVLAPLTDYNEKDTDFAAKSFYAAVAVSLGHHARLGRQVEDWAFKQMEAAAQRIDSARRGWAAVVLADLAVEAEDDVWSLARREQFERRLQNAITRLDWLQQERTDYTVRGVENGLGVSNQATLLQLFAQANSFFAMKDEDGFLKQMVSAGGLNPVGRAMMSDEDDAPGRFSDTGENFYLHSPTPGTDGKGHFADTLNGRRHFILSTLVQALFLSYYTRQTEQSSLLMQQFVRSYLTVDSESRFVRYLYVPLQGMRLAMVLHNSSSLYGWEKEEAALQQELYGKLKKGYPWKVVCSGVQGACEVAAEWIMLGKVFSWIGKGLGAGARAVGRQVISSLSPKALLYIGVGQLVVKQGTKSAMRWGRQSIKMLLQRCGWAGTLPAAAGTVAAGAAFNPSRPIPAR